MWTTWNILTAIIWVIALVEAGVIIGLATGKLPRDKIKKKIKNRKILLKPTDDKDATTKSYVDTLLERNKKPIKTNNHKENIKKD